MFGKAKYKDPKKNERAALKHSLHKEDGKIMTLFLHRKEWYNIMSALVDSNKHLDREYKAIPKNSKEYDYLQKMKSSNMKIYKKISNDFYK